MGELLAHEGHQSRSLLSPATIRKTYVIVAEALKLAVARSRLLHDPNIEADLPKLRQPDHRYLSQDQVRSLAETIDLRYRPFA